MHNSKDSILIAGAHYNSRDESCENADKEEERMETRWETNIESWSPAIDANRQREMALALEQGKIIYLPQLAFEPTFSCFM